MKHLDDKQNALLDEAAEWRLLSLLFDCPSDEWYDEVEALGNAVRDKKLKRAAKCALREATDGLFHSVFGPGGPAPGREVSYRGWVQPGYMLAEISSFYDAFSYKPKTFEAPDHVSVETGFIAYLRLKELYALDCEDPESASIARKASADFVNDHLSKFTEQLARILGASGIEYLSLTSSSLMKRVGRDKDKRASQFLPVLEQQNEEESLFECGLA